MKTRPSSVLFLLVLTVGLAMLVLLDGAARQAAPKRDRVHKKISLPSAAVALVSFGERPLVADYLWIDAVQYIGRTLAHHKHDVVDGRIVEIGLTGESVPVAAENVYRLVMRLTDIDPNFVYPYYITSLFLLDPHIESDLAMGLLRLGVERNPENWFLRAYYGFQLFMVEREVEAAIRELDIAASLPGAAPYVGGIRQNLRTASRRELTLIFLKGAIQRASTKMERTRLREQLDELEAGGDFDLKDLDHHHHHHHHHGAEPERHHHTDTSPHHSHDHTSSGLGADDTVSSEIDHL